MSSKNHTLSIAEILELRLRLADLQSDPQGLLDALRRLYRASQASGEYDEASSYLFLIAASYDRAKRAKAALRLLSLGARHAPERHVFFAEQALVHEAAADRALVIGDSTVAQAALEKAASLHDRALQIIEGGKDPFGNEQRANFERGRVQWCQAELAKLKTSP